MGQGEIVNGYELGDLVNVNLASSVPSNYADATTLVRHYGAPIEHVAEHLNQSHIELEQFTTDLYQQAGQLANVNVQLQELSQAQANAIANQNNAILQQDAIIQQYANHMLDHQQFVANIIPHIARYEQMEELLTDPNLLLNWYQNLAAINSEYTSVPTNQSGNMVNEYGVGQSGLVVGQVSADGQPVYSVGQSGNVYGNPSVDYVARQLGRAVHPMEVQQALADAAFNQEAAIKLGLTRPQLPAASSGMSASMGEPQTFADVAPWQAYKLLDELESQRLIGIARHY